MSYKTKCFYCTSDTTNKNQICNLCNFMVRASGITNPEAFIQEFYQNAFGAALTSEITHSDNQVIKIVPFQKIFYFKIDKNVLPELVKHKTQKNLYYLPNHNFIIKLKADYLFKETDSIYTQCKLLVNTSQRARIYYILKIRAYTGTNFNMPLLTSFKEFFTMEFEKRLYSQKF